MSVRDYNTRSSSSKPESASDNTQIIEAVNDIKNSLIDLIHFTMNF